jgi:hypothetical protein
MRIAVISLVTVCAVACAQQTATTRPATDPQNIFEPREAIGAGQALLARFAGDWDMVKTFYPRGGGAPVMTKGECRQRMIHDGRFLQSDFTFFDEGGKTSTGTGISGFDPKTNRFTTVWYDSHQTTMSIRQSDGTFDGREIVLYATTLSPDRPGRRSVARAHLEENGRVLLHRHYSIDEAGKETLIFELRLTQKK